MKTFSERQMKLIRLSRPGDRDSVRWEVCWGPRPCGSRFGGLPGPVDPLESVELLEQQRPSLCEYADFGLFVEAVVHRRLGPKRRVESRDHWQPVRAIQIKPICL
jgi:hypothetical protein